LWELTAEKGGNHDQHLNDVEARGEGITSQTSRASGPRIGNCCKWIETSLESPDDRDKAWWSDFEASLRNHRLTFRPQNGMSTFSLDTDTFTRLLKRPPR
jgi:hypothetical protein